jgi:1,4-alpha-glucan branching enzyme
MLLTEHDIYHFREGTYFRAYERLGAHAVSTDAARATHFAVWAPNASAVSVVGDFNGWQRGRHPLHPRYDSSGIWEGTVEGIGPGALYKYHVVGHDGRTATDKADPYAFRAEVPPHTASVVWDLGYEWRDEEWMRTRARQCAREPLVDLRGAPGILAARSRRGQSLARLP